MPDTRPAWQRWRTADTKERFKIVGAGIGAALIAALLIGGFVGMLMDEAPACDGEWAMHRLSALYDNKRLLRATDVRAPRQLAAGIRSRSCMATVTFADCSRREVRYAFESAGRSPGHRLRIDYNK